MTSAATCDQNVGTSTLSARNTTEPSGLRISLVVSRNSMSAYADCPSFVYRRSIRIVLPLFLSAPPARGIPPQYRAADACSLRGPRPDPRFHPVDPARLQRPVPLRPGDLKADHYSPSGTSP